MTAVDRTIARRARAAASAAVAAIAVVAAAVAHGIAGGGIASAAAMATALVVALPVGMIVVGSRITAVRAAIGVVLDQAIFHGVFSVFGPAGDRSVGVHHAHHSAAITVHPGASHASLEMMPMMASHAAAALVAFAVLLAGRDALARAITTLTCTLFIALGLSFVAATARRRRVLTQLPEPDVARGVEFLTAHPHRGPPIFLVSEARAS